MCARRFVSESLYRLPRFFCTLNEFFDNMPNLFVTFVSQIGLLSLQVNANVSTYRFRREQTEKKEQNQLINEKRTIIQYQKYRSEAIINMHECL